MMTTTSERATEKIKQPSKRVCCPYCEGHFDLFKANKPRSPDQHKRFFAVIRAAFNHWPEVGDTFTPDSAEHLRQWLTCKAGPIYRTVKTYEVPDSGNPIFNAKLMEFTEQIAANSGPFQRWIGLTLHVFTPKSIRWEKMPHLQFVALNNAVDDVLKAEIGLNGDELLEKEKDNI